MTDTRLNWKDIANAQLSKAVALAITILMFAFLLAPKSDVKIAEQKEEVFEARDVPQDNREEEETKTQEVQIDIPMSISEELSTDASVELDPAQLAALTQFGDLQKTDVSFGNDDRPFEFVDYSDAPYPATPIRPEYPEFAKRAGLQGTVWLEVDVYKDGSISDIRVKRSVQSGPGGLDQAAIDAVKRVRFIPGKSGGNPVDTTVNIPVEFRLN